jgi:lauroyl/myristoyl acyltransferase
MDIEAKDDFDLEAAVVAARQPLGTRRMPSVGLRLRIRTSPSLRRLLPTPLVLAQATASARASWKNDPAERERALHAMRALLEGTPRESEVEGLARQHLIEEAAHRALFWQPWKKASMEDASREHFRAAASQPRGVVLSACHMGPIFLYMSAISSKERAVYIVSSPWFVEQPTNDYWGRRIARWWKGLEPRNECMIYRPGATRVMQALLQEGEIVLNYFDMPGTRATGFLGKQVMLASSTARVAVESDALVLPVRARRTGTRAWADVAPALDARDFSGRQELQEALAGVHERWILELPATVEDPTRPGSWAAEEEASSGEGASAPAAETGRSGRLPA